MRLLKNGGQVVELLKPVMKGADRYNYMIVDPKLGKVQELPDFTFPMIPGHVSRIYDEYYKVVKHYGKGKVDGKTAGTDVTMAMYGTAKEANDFINAANAKSKSAVYRKERISEFDYGENIIDEFNIVEDMQRMYSADPRGTRLRGAWGGQAKIEDPLRAVFKDIQMVSGHTGIADHVNVIKKRIIKRVPDLAENGRILKSKDDVDKVLSLSRLSDTEKNYVKDLLDYVEMLENRPVAYRKAWYDFVFNTAEGIEALGLGTKPAIWASRAIKDNFMITDPINLIKTVKFKRYIQGRPLRQAILQSSQLLQYSVFAPSYIKFPLHLMGIGMMAITDGRGVKSASKIAGISESEMKQVWQAFSESGLLESVKSHPFVSHMRSGIYSNPVVKQKDPLSPSEFLDRWTFNILGKGFESGEALNLMGAYLVARREFVQKFGDIKAGTLQGKNEIAARARIISTNMNHAGKFNYQRGFFSAAMQFSAAPHKAFTMLLSNKHLTTKQKFGMAALNVALFGEHALMMSRVFDHAVTTERVMHHASGSDDPNYHELRRGIMNYTFNAALSQALGYETNIDFAKGISPTEGWYEIGMQFMESLLENNLIGALSGVSGDQIEWVRQVATDFNVIAELPNIETVDEWQMYMASIARFVGGWSDYEKFQFARRYGAVLDGKGNLFINSVNPAEAWAKVFGLSTDQETAMHKYMNKDFDKRAEIKDVAKRVSTSINNIYRTHKQDKNEMVRQMAHIRFQFAHWEAEDKKELQSALLAEMYRSVKSREDTYYGKMMEKFFDFEGQYTNILDLLGTQSDETQKAKMPFILDLKDFHNIKTGGE